MTYGSLIKQAREEQRLTQEQLAEELDISRQAVSKWEADLSKPTREKLDRLSDILDIPPERWAEIDAEIEAAKRPPDHAKPWKIATGVLGAVCLALVVALAVVLRPGPKYEDTSDAPAAYVPGETDFSYENDPIPEPETETLPVIPETIPLDVEHDYTFGDWPLGTYEAELVPFLSDGEQVMEHELWVGWFPDGTRLSYVKCAASWDPEYLLGFILWAPPVEQTGGVLDCRILFQVAEGYKGEESGDPKGGAFANVLGYDGLKLTLSAADDLYRDAYYFSQREDGSVCMITITGGGSYEADVDEDGVLEIVYYEEPAWRIIDTERGEEGAFVYRLSDDSWVTGQLSSDPYISGFDLERQGFVTLDGSNTVLARYILRDGEMVKVPPTDFSAADYPDVAETEITFVTDVEVLSDGYGPDVILPYNPAVRITHRQQAYIALQELYNLTGLKVDSCYCAAGDFSIVFSLLEDGFDQRCFYSFWPNGSLGSYGEESNISSFSIAWQELGNDWSPLVFADAVKAEGADVAEKIHGYYDRLSFFSTGEVEEVIAFPAPDIAPDSICCGEIWLEDGALYNAMYQFVDGEPVLTTVYGPYPDGIVNH